MKGLYAVLLLAQIAAMLATQPSRYQTGEIACLCVVRKWWGGGNTTDSQERLSNNLQQQH